MDPRLSLSLVTAKTIQKLTTSLTKGGGTAVPGLYALKTDPRLIPKLSTRLAKGTIVVAGTNGKTTTSRMLSTILKEADISYIHNKEGSNLLRGIASTLTKHATIKNRTIADYALWEVDEATLPQLFEQITPSVVILTNLFRDQLDRYGEVNKIRNTWAEALKTLPRDTTLVLNADDPSIAFLGQELQCKVIYYGLEYTSQSSSVSTVADANFCAVCRYPLTYEAVYFSHVGKYACPHCGFTRPKPSIVGRNIDIAENHSSLSLYVGNGGFNMTVNLPGLYNVYNAIAAASAAMQLGIDKTKITTALRSFTSAFGRVEEIDMNGKKLKLFLVKNPTGFNEVISTLITNRTSPIEHMVIGINDNFADGTDVSWLWDVNFESINNTIEQVTSTGIRAYDLAVRLKYAEFPGKLFVEQDLPKIIENFIHSDQTKLIVLPTYTVMLELRQYLAKKGYIKHYLSEA